MGFEEIRRGVTTLPDAETYANYQDLVKVRAEIKKLEKQKEELEGRIKGYLLTKRATILCDERGQPFVSAIHIRARSKLDIEKMRKDEPAIYGRYLKLTKAYTRLKVF